MAARLAVAAFSFCAVQGAPVVLASPPDACKAATEVQSERMRSIQALREERALKQSEALQLWSTSRPDQHGLLVKLDEISGLDRKLRTANTGTTSAKFDLAKKCALPSALSPGQKAQIDSLNSAMAGTLKQVARQLTAVQREFQALRRAKRPDTKAIGAIHAARHGLLRGIRDAMVRARLDILALLSDPQKQDAAVRARAIASAPVEHFDCSDYSCDCTGDDDCEDMFDNGPCGSGAWCDEYSGFWICHCAISDF